MVSREGKDTALQLHNRLEASKKVKLNFTDFAFQGFVTLDENGNQKHAGKIDLHNPLNTTCSCDSFLYGMRFYKENEFDLKIHSRHVNETGDVFQCKHIIRAKYYRTFKPMEIEA